MNVLDLLSQLRQAKIQVALEGEKLKIKAPQGALTAELKNSLKKHKQEIIEFLQESQKPTADVPTIKPINRSGELPLSYTQKAVWTLEKINPDSIAYNLPMAFKFMGDLKVDLLESSIKHVLNRHESLRMTVAENEEGEPYAVFGSVDEFSLAVHALRIENASDYDAVVKSSVEHYALRPFDLAQGPLYRFELLHAVGEVEDHYVLVICLHHIISDGLSQNLLVREIALAYAAKLNNQSPPLAGLPIQYVDFAAWQKEKLSGENLDKEVGFWKQQLKDVPSLLSLPTDRPRPHVQTTNGAKYHFAIEPEVAKNAITLCQSKGITLFMGLMAALQVVLARHAQQTDFCVGMPTAGRSLKELEQLIGFFVNGILVRADLNGNPSWNEHLNRVKQRVLDVMGHQDTPAQLIVDHLNISRNPSYPPLAQVGFQLQNFAGAVQGGEQDSAMLDTFKKMTNLSMEPIRLEEADSKFDMIISVAQNNESLDGYVEYNTDLFNEDTIVRMIRHFSIALQSMQDEALRVNDVQLDSEQELQQHLSVAPDEKLLRLTTTQLAFVQDIQLRPDTKQYAVGFRYKADKALDVGLLRQSIVHACNSSSSLKARFVGCDLPWADIAYQVIANSFAPPIEFIDIDEQANPEAFVERHHNHWCYVAQDIFKDDLIRFQILQNKEATWLLMASHHIVMDGIAGNVLLERIAQTYNDLIVGSDAPAFKECLPSYIERHYQQVDTPDSVEFWLDKSRTVAPLSFSLSKSLHSNSEYQILCQPVDEQLLAAVKKYCRSKKIHASIFFRLVSALTIQQYCRPEEDFIIWDIQAGRLPEEADGIGVFYQQVPYIIEKDTISAMANADAFFKQQRSYRKEIKDKTFLSLQVLNRLFPAGSVSFQYNYFNFIAEVDLGGTKSTPDVFSSHVDNAVQVFIKDYGESLSFELWFDGAIMVPLDFLERLIAITTQITSNDPTFGELNYLLPQEREQLNLWNANESALDEYSTIVEWFYGSADKYAALPALLYRNESYSYEQLNKESNRLANMLTEKGISKGDRVAICIGRDPWFLISIWAVIKSGATYIPIEASYPKERVQYILDDSGSKLFITEQCIVDRLGSLSVDSILVNQLMNQLSEYDSSNVAVNVTRDDPIYIIYTSGSTGNPKGALVTHGGEVNLLNWYTKSSDYQPGDRNIIVSAFGFDLTQKNLFAPLLCGGALVVPHMDQYDADIVAEEIENHSVTHINCAPSAFYALTEHCDEKRAHQLQSLKWVFLGGESIRIQALDSWLQNPFTKARIVNSYGPTECTDVVAAHEIQQTPSEQSVIPIGAPINNTQLYIVNEAVQLVPHGLIGEIAVAGSGVGSGYLNQNELTEKVFIENPFGDGKLYLTGDLGRFLPSGEIEYIGRKDFQVKLRGLRIELGEVEAAVKTLSSVSDALVIVHEEQLVTYVVSQNGIEPKGWQSTLREKLPDYMVPAQIIALESWPLTPNGKVDRKALPSPADLVVRRHYVEPRNDVEFAIAEIWSQVLKQDQVGVLDNFFDLGGHSLLANQIVTRIRKQFDVDMPLRDIITHPTVAQLSDRVALAKRSAQSDAITECDRSGRIPLSAPQKRLWLLDKIEPGNAAYHIPSVIKIQGNINFEDLEKAFSFVVNQHEGLRAVFKEDEQGPYQLFLQPQSWALSIDDYSELDEDQAKLKVAAIITKPFDLEQGPLFRAHACKLSVDNYVLVVVIHHIVTDGWSNNILIQQLGQSYIQLVTSGEAHPPTKGLQYADFAVWQQSQLNNEILNEKVSFWTHQLEDVPVLELPTDYTRPTVQTFNGASVSFSLNEITSQALFDVAKQYQCTPFMVLLACYSAILQKYSGQDDFAIGTPVAGRDRLELENIVGFFVNTVAVRVNPNSSNGFAQFLETVKESVLASFENQDIPFEDIVETVNPQRDMSRSPIFQVMMAYQDMPVEDQGITLAQFGDVEFSSYELDVETTKFDQTLTLWPQAGKINGSLSFNIDLFSHETAQQFVSHFVALCEDLLVQPEKALYQANYLSQSELTKQIGDWNKTDYVYDKSERIEEKFSRCVTNGGDSVAVVYGGETLSYSELDDYSNQIAQALSDEGISEGDFVGILMDRNLHLMTALMGVLKAGSAYVPIDASYPQDRIHYICEQSGIKVVLTQNHLAEKLDQSLKKIAVDQFQWCKGIKFVTPSHHVDALIYMIFTSGSTGLPKGTAAYHRSEINLLNWYTQQFSFDQTESVLLLSAIGFDLTQKNLFAPLIKGGRLIIPDFQEFDPEKIVSTIEREEVTWINCAPSAFYPLIENPEVWPRLSTLKHVFLGGEPINVARLQPWMSQANCKVINSYGPTECTDIAAWHELCLANDVAATAVPIGRPNYNVQLYVLGDHQEPLPVGAVGELCIAGDGVGPGYIHQQELTNSVFVDNPFHDRSKLYRTGDRVRYRSDGAIVFLGRKDHQIKLRGYRIEVAEIQAVINQNEVVNDSLVGVLKGHNGVDQLVAWVESDNESESLLHDLIDHCAKALPNYMLPDAWVVVSRFPLTPNGKIDRKALPNPEWNVSSKQVVEPRTDTEISVAEIWREVLNVEPIGVHDNFFDLGGHSLLATQVAARIRARLGFTLQIRDLMLHPTIEAIASRIDKLGDQEQDLPLVAIDRAQRIPLSFAQQRLWLLDKIEGSTAAYNVPSLLRITGKLNSEDLQKSLRSVFNRHEGLRACFKEDEIGPYQTILSESDWALPIEVISGTQQEKEFELKRLAAIEVMTPFLLEQGPLFRARLFKLGNEEYVFSVVIHHIVTDGWSMNILVRDLVNAYLHISQYNDVYFDRSGIQYADFAAWQRQRLDQNKQAELLDYWQNHLHSVEPIQLPLDYPRPKVQTFNGKTERFTLDASTVGNLKSLALKSNSSLFAVLMSAFSVILQRYSGQDDFAIGTPIAGRDHTELENVVGFFVNTLAIRVNPDPNLTFSQLVENTKTSLLDGFAHQELPFEQIVEAIDPARDMSRSPIFQVMLAYQNLPVDQQVVPKDAALGNLQVQPYNPGVDSSKYEMTLTLWDEKESLGGSLQYNTDLFSEKTIKRFVQHFTALAAALGEHCNDSICAVSFLDKEEIEQQVVEWNLTDEPYDSEIALHEAISEKAKYYNNRIAVKCGNAELTYDQLEMVSSQFSNYLIDNGVQVGERVAICVDRNLHLLSIILGVLKAGGTYVPLDASYPKDRLEYIIREAEIKKVVTFDRLAKNLPEQVGKVDWDDCLSGLNNYSSQAAKLDVSSEQLLYLIFTSGSTGNPKGTGAYHRSELNLLNWYCGQFNMTENDKVLLLSAIGFDLTQKNLFAPLLSGACLIIPEFQEFDAQLITKLIEDENISWMNCAPSAFYPLQDEPHFWSSLHSLRLLFLGGEPINLPRLESWLKTSNCQLINSYGPTECTDIATWYPIDVKRDINVATLPIGRPNYNVKLYVLGEHQELLPIGAIGELCISGAGVGPGYINNEEQTQYAFLENPYQNRSTLYRTGDRVRYRDDGVIEYLGRKDHQIKLRGYRIEAAEIQARINLAQGVKDSLVDIVKDDNGVQRLSAWVVTQDLVDETYINSFVAEFLPEFMVPELWQFLPKFPLTPNGKVDRKALPVPLMAALEELVEPKTELEAQLCELWSSTLGIERVGTNHNFFKLGGQSLLATQLVSRVSKVVGKPVPVRTLFENPTVHGFLLAISNQSDDVQRPKIQRRSNLKEAPLSFGQQRLWVFEKLNPGSSANNMPVALRIGGILDHSVLEKAFIELIRRHESLRTSFVDTMGGDSVQIVDENPKFNVKMSDISSLSAEAQDAFVEASLHQNATEPFSLSAAPLIRAQLIQKESESILLVCMHHIISDGASQVILFRELMTIYLAYLNMQPSPLQELTIQYPDFAAWQREWLSQDDLEHHLEYWQKQLQGAPSLLELPLDFKRPDVQRAEGETFAFEFDSRFVTQLKAVCADKAVTPFMFSLLAWKLLLARYSGQEDVVVGVPTLGRHSQELESVIGFFIQSLVLRSDLSGNPSVEDALYSIRQTVLDAFAHGDVPVDLIVERLGVPRNPAYSPLVQVAFQLLDQGGFNVDGVLQNAKVGDLEVEVMGASTQTSKFDLTMNLSLNADKLAGSLEFSTALFKRETIRDLVEHYKLLCSNLLSNLTAPIDSIELVNKDDLLSALNLDQNVYEKVLPLTAMQYDMFMDNLVNPNSLQSSHGWHIHINRQLDLGLWEKSIQWLTDRQEMLRVEFVTAEPDYLDMGYLAVRKEQSVDLKLFDMSQATDTDVIQAIQAFIYRPYSLTGEQLLEHGVFKLADDHYVVSTAVHHAVLDGASLHVYWLQLIQVYDALGKGEEPVISIPEFSEYIQHDRGHMDTADVLGFWQNQLCNVEPLDFTVPAPVPAPSHFVTKELFLSDDHWHQVKHFCRSQRITPALYFKCLYGLLISAYCRPDSDFVIQETMGGRIKGHNEGYGCYIQEIPFVFAKDEIAPVKDFRSLLQYAKTFQKTIKNQRLISIGKQIELSPRGRIGFMFNFYQFLNGVEFLGQTFYPEGTPSDPANNVQFVVTEVANKLKLNLFYHGHLFSDFDMLTRIESLSKQVIANETLNLDQLHWVTSPSEKVKLLETWNDTHRNYDLTLCVHQKFENQVVLTPESIAIVDDHHHYSYQQLNRKANQLAHFLLDTGVQPNDLVGLCADRSCDFLVGILGVMKAGAAYVPMDPKYPDDRIAYMIDNSAAKVLITQSHLLDKASSAKEEVTILCLDRDAEKLTRHSEVNPNLPVTPRNRAYMIYTSGSTGLPKGAIVRHDGALNHIEAEREVLEFDGPFSFLQTAPSSSDISVWQFLGPVICGGKVVVLDDVTHSRKLFELVKEHQIDVVELVPVALQLLMEYVRTLPTDERSLPHLKWMMATGEAVSVDLVNAWLSLYADIPVVNAYGPTEAADDVIQCSISSLLPSEQRSVPIGKPLPNLSVYIVDDQMRLLPAGVPGEICIGGVGVGEGYWNNAEKTEQVFVANPYNEDDTLYRTGDLGRWLHDGTVEYLDRVDNQVKVRGFRIELGEVEAALSAIEGVRENVVIVRDDLPGGTALAAYVVATDQSAEIDPSQLRALMRASVPDFMVPASITIMEALPLTPAGKVDRKALPRPEAIQTSSGEYIPPRTDTEEKVASIWESLMPQEKISIRDNFFEIGGHSLIGVRIIAKLNKEFGLQLQVAALLQTQTIEKLSELIDEGGSTQDLIIPMQQSSQPPLFVIHPVGGDVLCYADLAAALANEFSIYGIRSKGLDGETEPFENLEQMVDTYVEAMQQVQPQGPYRLLGQSIGGIIATAVARKLEQGGESVEHIVMLDTFSPAHLNSSIKSDQQILAAALGQSAPVLAQQKTENKTDAYIETLYKAGQNSGTLPPELSLLQFTGIYKVAVQNHTIATQYKVEKLNANVHHFTAEQNQTGTSSCESWKGSLAFTSTQTVPGGHESMMQGTNAKQLAQSISTLLTDNNNNE